MIEQLRQLWDALKAILRGDHTYPQRKKTPQSQPPAPPAGPDESQRYHVLDEEGQMVGSRPTFAEAHQLWSHATSQNGNIIDTQQDGLDVTPPRDDNGRYVVLDEDGNQQGSFNDFEHAVQVWEDETDRTGTIIDMQQQVDVTPRDKAYLSDEQLTQLLGIMAGFGPPSTTELGVDPGLVEDMTRQINNLPLKIFDLANIEGQFSSLPTKTVPIKRQKVVIEEVRELVEVDAVETTSHRRMIPVIYPTDESEPRLMRSVSEVRRVRRRSMALPEGMLKLRIAKKQLPIDEFQEEIVEQQYTPRKKKVWQTVEKPRIEEWTESIEVAEESRAQLLLTLMDVSGSMTGKAYMSVGMLLARRRNTTDYDPYEYLAGANPCINLAVALKTLLVGKHLDDGSRYLLRQFADIPGDIIRGESPQQKRTLIKFLLNQRSASLGGGTQVQPALERAARDVRSVASHDDRPHILIITDGNTPITAQEVYDCVGSDVLLHTVIVGGGSNRSLYQHSASYNELHWDGQQVTVRDRPTDSDISSFDWR